MIRQTIPVEVGVAAGLLLIDGLGWRFVSAIFDRERLVTGTKSWGAHDRQRRSGGDARHGRQPAGKEHHGCSDAQIDAQDGAG